MNLTMTDIMSMIVGGQMKHTYVTAEGRPAQKAKEVGKCLRKLAFSYFLRKRKYSSTGGST